MRKIIVMLVCLLGVTLQGQQVRRDHTGKVTIRGAAGIPKPISSAQFYKSFSGVMEGNVSASVRVAGDLSAGLGYQGTVFKCTETIRTSPPFDGNLYNTGLTCNSGFFRLGYDHFFKPNAFAAFALNIGQMYGKYTRVNEDTSALNQPLIEPKFSTLYLQPEFAVNFLMEQRLAFSLMISYTTLLQRYDPRAPRFAHFEDVNQAGNKYLMSYFTFGFGFSVLLGD